MQIMRPQGGGSMTDEEEGYPSLRHAVFGDEHVANVYCVIKWASWHVWHLLMALVVAVVALVVVPLYVVGAVIWYLLARLGVDERGGEAAKTVTTHAAGLSERNVTRRIYGYCPVSMDLEPRWFVGLHDAALGVVNHFRPAKDGWECTNCGETLTVEPLNHAECFLCHDGEWIETEVKPERILP